MDAKVAAPAAAADAKRQSLESDASWDKASDREATRRCGRGHGVDGVLDRSGPELAEARAPRLALDLSAAPRRGGLEREAQGEEYVLEDKITLRQETPVHVVFELPDGSVDERDFLLGQTVLFLKSYLEAEFDMPMATQALFLHGEHMLGPLSLLDFDSIGGSAEEEVYIVVEGDMGDSARK